VQVAEEEVSPPPGERRDDEGEAAGRDPDSETFIHEPAPQQSGPVSESFIREEMFRQGQQQAGEESAPSAPSTQEAAPGVGATSGEGEQVPAGPSSFGVEAAGEDELDTSDWHAAFERLASEREETLQAPDDADGADQSPPHEDTPEPGAPAPGLDMEGVPDLPSWQQAFEKLSRERAGDDEAETGGDGPSDAAMPGTQQQPTAEMPLEASRSEEFDRLRRMAEQGDSSDEAPDPQMNESERDARRAEFERIRREAQDLNTMPMPPASPDATPGAVERMQ
jgi:hypothetical protein